ncbi:peptide chain release factor N(5)-glutamine methyltransferase [Methylotuvimicrobium buryatense]|uniref:Release factor glutamine methyltransferase n=1 Tax=Methylotuvimicrobium buryatense TaxID=95641 RepID=A0A4P9UMP6_METBY|nr:peptide chain release factor N(5)-glutamine methyltransferase [Methylotuvimicrobium buryatense]QCW81461.1 peptide chain release factor N(5)-glutamine methyltransferase [Methylotuvimicrobium buryatense]
MPTVQSALNDAVQRLISVSESSLLDAEILLCLVLEKDRSHLRAWPEKKLLPEQNSRFEALLQKRLSGMPIAYITGNREFWSRDFEVCRDVLIPRPDTELLIELALKLIPERQPYRLIDLGTGSGIIAITLAAERPDSEVIATDFSTNALAIARRNAQQHNVRNIQFLQSDWLEAISDTALFNLVVSNPPYVSDNDPHLAEGDVRFEPKSALIANNHGLSDIERIATAARRHLLPQGHLLIEHGYNQQDQVQAIFSQLNYRNIATYPDLSGQPRVTYGQWRS